MLLEVNSEGQVINTKLWYLFKLFFVSYHKQLDHVQFTLICFIISLNSDFSVATTIRPSKKYRDPVGTARWYILIQIMGSRTRKTT